MYNKTLMQKVVKSGNEPSSTNKSINEQELKFLSEADANEPQIHVALLSESDGIKEQNEDIQSPPTDYNIIEEFDELESNRLHVLKEHTQRILQDNLNDENYYQYSDFNNF